MEEIFKQIETDFKKFRAWGIKEKAYLKLCSIHLSTKRVIVSIFGRAGGNIGLPFSRVILEQYTGLKDKNGKEIYEGDIIQENLSFNNEAVDGIFKYMVYWNENELCWSLKHIGNESIHDDLWECNSSIEIIGNIHENPELLEDN